MPEIAPENVTLRLAPTLRKSTSLVSLSAPFTVRLPAEMIQFEVLGLAAISRGAEMVCVLGEL